MNQVPNASTSSRLSISAPIQLVIPATAIHDPRVGGMDEKRQTSTIKMCLDARFFGVNRTSNQTTTAARQPGAFWPCASLHFLLGVRWFNLSREGNRESNRCVERTGRHTIISISSAISFSFILKRGGRRYLTLQPASRRIGPATTLKENTTDILVWCARGAS